MTHTSQLIITIDGPAGSGKSTVAHQLARRLGLDFLDTGAMYRAAALIAREQNIQPDDGVAIAAALRASKLHFDWSADPPSLHLTTRVDDDEQCRDISDAIRELDVSEIVSVVAAQSEVRDVLVEQQRRIAEDHPRLVSEGRDQGSVVFPDAPLHFFLKANATVRARRRVEQLERKGVAADLDRVVADIKQRDALDSQRAVGPLTCPDDAIVVDTSELALDAVIDRLESVAREKLSEHLDADDA